MTEFEWRKQLARGDVAAVLRQIADGLEEDGTVELEQDSWELKLSVPGEVGLAIELEIDGDEAELEVELKWSASRDAASSVNAADTEDAAGEE